MLVELRIRRLGVIEDALLPLGPGLTVVTGETGAGKTMVVTGLLLLFGGRADAARVRTGADRATVDGRLTLEVGSAAAERVRAAGGDLDDEPGGTADLVLRRTVTATGRSRAHAGGAAVPVAVLSDLAHSLLTVHGQADQLRLARPAAQRAALDGYAGLDLSAYQAAFADWRAAADALADRIGRAGELRREADLLARGIAEIESVSPRTGEDVELARRASRLEHADVLASAARIGHDVLLGCSDDPIGGTDVASLVADAARHATQQRGADEDLDALASRLGELGILAVDLGADLAAYAAGLETDPEALQQVQGRRAELAALVRKYCDEPEPSVAGVLRWAAAARARLDEIDVSDEAIALLGKARDQAQETVSRAAQELSTARRGAAARLAAAVTTELRGLAMPESRLTVQVSPRAATAGAPVLTIDGVPAGAAPDGCDDVVLLLQPHSGAPALPLGRGASGGELSRVMLAIEVCLHGSAGIRTGTGRAAATPPFCEGGGGVGGRAAVEVGRRLARLARDSQVLVVTHLAQVAAFADRHVVVDKPAAGAADPARAGAADPAGAGPADPAEAGNGAGHGTGPGVARSDVRVVTGDDQVTELARMLAGTGSAAAREHAAELLAAARASDRDPGVRPG